MNISTDLIKELREKSGAGIMECRNALVDAAGDVQKAHDELKGKGLLKAQKKAERVTNQGVVEAYIHTGGRIGAIIEVNSETDFAARTDEFKELARCLAMQVAAMDPRYVSEENIPEGEDAEAETVCLLSQPYIKDTSMTVKDLIIEAVAKVGENIQVNRFSRFELGN